MSKEREILITGVAGFIGSALAKKLIKSGFDVVGLDNLNSYYDVSLKKARLNYVLDEAKKNKVRFKFYKCGLEDRENLENIFSLHKSKIVVHLAAQAGVRYSLINPDSYFKSNLLGFYNILELIKDHKVENFIFASSSSVYGGNKEIPFSEVDKVDKPLNLYAASKKSNELLAYSYSHLYKIPTTGLRFFTVYGPWGRPDMAPMIFLDSILSKKPIKVFNNGQMKRDFTYIDDIVEGLYRCCFKPPNAINLNNDLSDFVPYKIFNIGNGKPVNLINFIDILEKKLNQKAEKIYLPMQMGDACETYSNTMALKNWINYEPRTNIEEGLEKLVDWFKNYYL